MRIHTHWAIFNPMNVNTMEIIFQYDIERLKAYETNPDFDNRICVTAKGDLNYLRFPEVDYFNYSFSASDSPLTHENVESIMDFYKSDGIERHKIITDADCRESRELLCGKFAYQQTKKLVKTSYAPDRPIDNHPPISLDFASVDQHNIGDFTHTYLNGFESEQKDYEKITRNFKRLLRLEAINLYLLRKNKESVGISVLYKKEQDYLLAGGAILKQHRSQQFHKYAMVKRIRQCFQNGTPTGIYSSAYQNSISLKNMLNIGMTIAKTYDIYEYCG